MLIGLQEYIYLQIFRQSGGLSITERSQKKRSLNSTQTWSYFKQMESIFWVLSTINQKIEEEDSESWKS